MKRKERRKYPRIKKQLPLRILANGYDFITTTENVSCIGAYCHIDKYIPPFTKVKVRLSLPSLEDQTEHNEVECNGIVVRTEDAETGGFKIAIFFNRINKSAKQKVFSYINQVISQKNNIE